MSYFDLIATDSISQHLKQFYILITSYHVKYAQNKRCLHIGHSETKNKNPNNRVWDPPGFGHFIILAITDVFSPPIKIFIDFFAITSSTTKEGLHLLHPSVATNFNETTVLSSLEDVDNLLSEFKQENLYEKVLSRHHLARTIDSEQSLISSNVRIERLICVWAYVDPL